MKKLLFIMLTVLMGISSLTLSAQNTLTVADGTSTNSNVPIHGTWADAYLRCQTIYTAGFLDAAATGYSMNGGTISSMTYYLSSPAAEAWTGTWEVKLMEVTNASLTGFIDMTDATTVYTGALDGTQSTLEIIFSTPYTYQGGNLLIEVSETTSGNWKSATFYGVSAAGASWQGYNSSAWTSITGSAQNFIPKTTFTFTGGSEISCSPVQNLTIDASQITSSSLTLTWTDDINTGATYTVYDMADNTVIESGINANTYTVIGLSPNTNYTFGVEANCSASESSAVLTVSGLTSCGAEALPFSENFDATLSNNPCWGGASILAANVFGGDPLNIGSITGWSYQSYENNGIPAGHYRVNIYGANCKYWLITPTIDLTTATSPLLSFDAAFTKYSSAADADGDITDDQFMIIVSTDNGATWDSTNVFPFNLANLASTSYLPQFVDLSDYAGQNIRIAFYAESTVSGGDNNLHIDNISIAESTGELCLPVTALTASNITPYTATLSWTGTANSYDIVDMQDTSWVATVTDLTYDITGLSSETQYTYGVIANCSSTSQSVPVSVTFTTLISCPAPTALNVTLNPNDPTEATLSWTENGTAEAWQIVINNDETDAIDVTTNSYTITGLIVDSVYTAKVRAICDVDDQSSWSSTISFEPTTKTVIGSGNATNNFLPTNCYYNYSLTQQIYTVAELGEEGFIESIDFYNNSTSERVRDLNIYIVSTAKDTFDNNTDWINATDADLQYSGSVSFAPQAWTTIALNGFVYDGLSNIAVIVDDNTGSYSSTTPFLAFSANKQALHIYSDPTNYDVANPTYTGTIEDTKNQIRLVKSPISGCMKPTGVVVNYLGGDQAEVSWTSDAASFNISVNGDVTNNVTNPYTLTGLSLATTYAISVQTVCGATTSDWTNPVSFTTDACTIEDLCSITITGLDSYGDGWNNASISIIQNGVTIGNFTLPSGSSSMVQTFNVCSGMPVSFSWNSGSYDSETSFEILDGGNTSVFSASGSDLAGGATFFTLNTPCPTCMPATNLTADIITINSVTLSWNGSADSYDIYNGEAFVANVTTNSYTINGLTPGTYYTFYVQAICSATDSASMVAIDVITECEDITTLPFYEDFEDGFGCWSTVNGSSDGMPWYMINDEAYAHSGSIAAVSFSYYNYSGIHADAWLISPKFVLPAVSNDSLTLSWWHRVNQYYPSEHYDVLISTTTKDTAAFTTTLLSVIPDSVDGYVQNTVDLTAYAGQAVYLAFHHHDSYNQDFLLIDDISLTQSGSTPAVDTLHLIVAINDANLGSTTPAAGTYNMILGESVLLTATPNDGVNFEGWRMIIAGQTVGTLPLNPYNLVVNENMIAFGELTVMAIFSDSTSIPDSLTVIINTADPTMGTTNPAPGTYAYAVGETSVITAVPNPGYNFLYWVESATISGMTITDTLYSTTVSLNVTPMYANMVLSVTAHFEAAPVEPCDVPTGLTVGNVTHESIAISWDNNANVSSWNIQYRPVGGTLSSATSTTNSYTITGLEPLTTYQIQVQAVCSDGQTSDWTAEVSATTLTGINDYLLNSISLYPNPAKDVVNVQCTMNDVQVESAEVFDVYGKLLQTVSMTPETTTINVSGLAAGMYFVRVTTEEGVVTKSFVKK